MTYSGDHLLQHLYIAFFYNRIFIVVKCTRCFFIAKNNSAHSLDLIKNDISTLIY